METKFKRHMSKFDVFLWVSVRPPFVDTLSIVRLRPNMPMRRAVIINYYFLVHKTEVENLILSSTQALLHPNEVSPA